jgi:uncharacterized membrane protein YbhN (UPF0104 family)
MRDGIVLTPPPRCRRVAARPEPAPLDAILGGWPADWRSAVPVRRLLAGALVVAVGVVAVLTLGGPARAFADALARAAAADPAWVAAGVALEALSIAGYVALFGLVSGAGAVASYRITVGGAAVTRLLPTAGAGGVAFTVWALRRATGAGTADAGALLLRFLVLLYAVFLAALAAGGALVASGAVDAPGGPALGAEPGGAAAGAMLLGLAFAAVADAVGPRGGRLVRGAVALGRAVRAALVVARGGSPLLLGAVVWWAADVAVLWATFSAVGTPPALGVLVFGYFLGAVGNTLPVPGAASGGTIAAFLALGVAPDLTLAAVLAYRAIAIWLPTPFGAAALAALRRQDGAPRAHSSVR